MSVGGAKLKWARFDVTDGDAFEAVSDAIEAGDYDKAQQLIDDWKEQQARTVEKDDENPDDEDSGPNATRKKRKLQSRAGREQDYDDIRSDSSSIAFDPGKADDNTAPIDRN